MFHFRDQEMNEGINISYILSYSDTKSVQNIARKKLRSNLQAVDDYYFHTEGKGYI